MVFMIGSYCSLMFTLFKFLATWRYSAFALLFCSGLKLRFSFSSSHSLAFWVKVYVADDGLAVHGGTVQRTIFNEYEQSLWPVGVGPVFILDQSDRSYYRVQRTVCSSRFSIPSWTQKSRSHSIAIWLKSSHHSPHIIRHSLTKHEK